MSTAIDIVIVLVTLALALVGYRRGLVGSALPLLGFLAGVGIGARLGPALLDGGSESPFAPAVSAACGVVLGLLLALVLDRPADRLAGRLAARRGTRVADGIGGAVLLGLLGLAACWVAGAVALHLPGEDARDLRRAAQESTILAAVNQVAPPSGPFLRVLRRVDPGTQVRGPGVNVEAPPESIAADPGVRVASDSVVAVHGNACGLGIAGSGWVAAADVVVTNAHVVAGERDTTVIRPDGAELDATVIGYSPTQDLAILSVPDLDLQSLAISPRTRSGTPGAVIGYPGGGSLTIIAARLGRTGAVNSTDSYGRGPLRRVMVPFRGVVRGGNSGGPVVSEFGQVLTTVFAIAVDDDRPPSGVGVPNNAVRRALASAGDEVDTGPCSA